MTYNKWLSPNGHAIASDKTDKIPEAAKVALDDRLQAQIDYSIDLQRIIESICHGMDIAEPKTTARHHYDMAVKYKNALQTPVSDVALDAGIVLANDELNAMLTRLNDIDGVYHWDGMFIRAALQTPASDGCATESEQLRKERDELARLVRKLVIEGCWDDESWIFARKVSAENGNT